MGGWNRPCVVLRMLLKSAHIHYNMIDMVVSFAIWRQLGSLMCFLMQASSTTDNYISIPDEVNQPQPMRECFVVKVKFSESQCMGANQGCLEKFFFDADSDEMFVHYSIQWPVPNDVLSLQLIFATLYGRYSKFHKILPVSFLVLDIDTFPIKESDISDSLPSNCDP